VLPPAASPQLVCTYRFSAYWKEIGAMNPLSSNTDDGHRKQTLGQLPIPMEKEEHLLDPWFYKCDGKIVKYDMRELGRWKVTDVLPP
jgi:hypothetical protein